MCHETMKKISRTAVGIGLLFLTGGCNKPPPITPQERAQLALIEHPRIISKEIVTRFHRVGDGLVVRTDSGTFEFIASDDCNIISPEDALKTDSELGPDAFGGDDRAKQPIYLISEDAGNGAEWILQQSNPVAKNVDDSPHTDECSVTPSN